MLFYCPELFSFPLDYTELQITINNKRKIVNNIETPYTIKHIIQARKNLHEMSKYSPWTIWWSELVDLQLHQQSAGMSGTFLLQSRSRKAAFLENRVLPFAEGYAIIYYVCICNREGAHRRIPARRRRT